MPHFQRFGFLLVKDLLCGSREGRIAVFLFAVDAVGRMSPLQIPFVQNLGFSLQRGEKLR